MNCCATFPRDQRFVYWNAATDRSISFKQTAISITVALATVVLVGSILCLAAQQGVELAGFNAISAMIDPLWPAIAGGCAAGVIISSVLAATALTPPEKCYSLSELQRWGIEEICTRDITLKMPASTHSFWCEDFALSGKSATVFVLYLQIWRGEQMSYHILGFKNSADRQEKVEQLRPHFVDANNWDAHNPTKAMLEAFKGIPVLLRDFWFWKSKVEVNERVVPVVYYKLPGTESISAHPFENGEARHQFLKNKKEESGWTNGKAASRDKGFQYSYADICAFVPKEEREKWDRVQVLEGTYFQSSLPNHRGYSIYAYALKTSDDTYFFANPELRRQKIEELKLLNARVELKNGDNTLLPLEPYREELENKLESLFPEQFYTRDFEEYGVYVLIVNRRIRYFSSREDRQIVQNHYEKTKYSLNEVEETIEALAGKWKIEYALPLLPGFVITKYLKIHAHDLTIVYYRNQSDLIVYTIFMDNAPIGHRAIDFMPRNELIHAFVYPLAHEDALAIKQKAAILRARNRDEYLVHSFESSGITFIAVIISYSIRMDKPIVNVLYMTEEHFVDFERTTAKEMLHI